MSLAENHVHIVLLCSLEEIIFTNNLSTVQDFNAPLATPKEQPNINC